jgi:hypothetical protein
VGLEDTVTLLVSLVTGLGVMLILLGVCLVVVCRRHRHRGAPHAPPRNSAPPLIYDPDRVALIADGAQLGEVRFRFLKMLTHLFNSVFAIPTIQRVFVFKIKRPSVSYFVICIINSHGLIYYFIWVRNEVVHPERRPQCLGTGCRRSGKK